MAKFENNGRPIHQLTKVTIGDKETWTPRNELNRVVIPKGMFTAGNTIEVSVKGTFSASGWSSTVIRVIDPNSIENRYRRSRKRLRNNN